jgi:hypothetical protein
MHACTCFILFWERDEQGGVVGGDTQNVVAWQKHKLMLAVAVCQLICIYLSFFFHCRTRSGFLDSQR